MSKIKISTLVVFVLISMLLNGQETQEKPQYKVISFVPQFFINNGIRIDFDYRINQRHWLQLSPQIYLSQSDFFSSYNITLKELAGIGLGVYDRIYLSREINKPMGSYFAYGLTCHLFSIKYKNELEADNADPAYHTNINKYGADFIIGRQFCIEDIFTIDFYIGTGLRYAIVKQDVKNSNYFNDAPWSYGFTGTMLIGGFRIGISK